jgi:succinyl-diaminopimelate desuccinylase
MISEKLVSSVKSYENEIVKLCSELVQIDTTNPPGNCSEVVNRLKEEYGNLGVRSFVVSEDKEILQELGLEYPRENFVARAGPANTTVGLLIGTHMDVVPAYNTEEWRYPPFSGVISDGKVWGRGACDAKCSLVAQLYAVKALVENEAPLRKSLVVAATVDDEAPGNKNQAGMQFLVDKGFGKVGIPLPEYAINAEASGLTEIWAKFSGHLTFSVDIRGSAAHPPMGVNALNHMVHLMERVLNMDKGRVNILHISCRTPEDVGSTPNFARVATRWSFNDKSVQQVEGKILEAIRIYEYENKVTLSLEPLESVDPVRINPHSKIVRAVKQASATVGINAKYGGGIVGAGDLYHLLKNGIAGITYGPGNLRYCHAVNEFVSTDELVKATQIYALCALMLCS